MKSTPKLIKRFLLILMLSLFLLLSFNLILLATVVQKFASSGSPWTSAEEVAAVSYTHLDVYKRQLKSFQDLFMIR